MKFSDIKLLGDELIENRECAYLTIEGHPHRYLGWLLWVEEEQIFLSWVDQDRMCVYSETAIGFDPKLCIKLERSGIACDDIEVSLDEVYPWKHPRIAPKLW